MHGAGAVSSEHANADPDREPMNVNATVELAVGPSGPDEIVVSGGAVSTVHVHVAGVGSNSPEEPALAAKV
jgi:hypothetical protein